MPRQKKTGSAAYGSEFAGRVKIYNDRLSRTDRQIADYLLRHEDSIEDFSIHMLADAIGVGVASIVRFSKVLGYKGFADMKFQIRQGKLMIDKHDIDVESEDDANLVKQKVLQFAQDSLEQCILNADNNTLNQVSQAIATASKVYVVGSGTSSYIAAAGASIFQRMGIFALTVEDSMLHLRAASYLRPGDVLIALNYSGDSKDIGDTLFFAHEAGATTVLLTSRRQSLLGKYANHILYTAVRDQSNSVNIAATAMSQLAILQVIQAIIQQKNVPRILRQNKTITGHGEITRYDSKQESIYPGKMRIAKKDSAT